MAADFEPFALTEYERHSSMWLRLKEHFESELARKRAQNDGPLTVEQTLTMRGHIEALKAVIRLGDDPPRLEPLVE